MKIYHLIDSEGLGTWCDPINAVGRNWLFTSDPTQTSCQKCLDKFREFESKKS